MLLIRPLLYISVEIGELWPRGSPWGAEILKGVKNFCCAFLVHRLAEHDEIWHNQRYWYVADLKEFR